MNEANASPTKAGMQTGVIVSTIVTVIGFFLFLTTRGYEASESFWAPYLIGFNRLGGLMLIFGFLWLALCMAHAYSTFFDLDRNMDSNTFMASMVAIVLATLVLAAVVLHYIPRTPPSRLPGDEASRIIVVRLENNFRTLIAGSMIMAGIAFASVPCRRFFRH